MILYVLVVRDRAADAFGRPFFAPSVGLAERDFRSEVNRPADDNNMYKYPDDYDLFLLGTYDDSTGQFSTGMPKQVMLGKDAVNKK